jgi:hypothetical protein
VEQLYQQDKYVVSMGETNIAYTVESCDGGSENQ